MLEEKGNPVPKVVSYLANVHIPNSSQTVYVLKNGMQIWICAQCLEGAKEPFDWPVVSFHLLQHCVVDACLFLSGSCKQVTCIPVASAKYEKFPMAFGLLWSYHRMCS